MRFGPSCLRPRPPALRRTVSGPWWPLALLALVPVLLRADDWPQWRGPTRDGVWRESGLLETFPAAELTPLWSVPVGPGFSGPTVAGDRVFVMDRVTASAEQERILCFDRRTGRRLWLHAYPCAYRDVAYDLGPRASVTVAGDLAFSLGTMGQAACLSVTDGRVLWTRNLPAEYRVPVSFWGMTSAPLVFGDLVIFQLGGAEACLVALDTRTGRERWRALDGPASYSPPRLVRFGATDAVLVWTGRWLAAVDAMTGRVLWQEPCPQSRMVHSAADPVWVESPAGAHVLLASFYDGVRYFAVDAATCTLRWHRTGPNERKSDAFNPIASTPLVRDGHVYGVHSHGEIRALALATGNRLWEDTRVMPPARWGTAHFVQNGDRTWITTETGEVVIARLAPTGLEVLSRAKILAPDSPIVGRESPVAWAHPAYAHRSIFARSDSRLVCISLAAPARP